MITPRELLRSVVEIWRCQIQRAKSHKKRVFGDTADRVWDFYGSRSKVTHALLERYGDGRVDHWRAGQKYWVGTINKASEFVRLMLPMVHHKAPIRVVEPDRPMIPPEMFGLPAGSSTPLSPLRSQDEGRAFLLEWWLNWLAEVNDLRGEGRPTVIEALTKGMGLMVHEMQWGPYGWIPVSSYDSESNWVMDPDAKRRWQAGWVARKRRRPAREVAAEFRIPVEHLRGQFKSNWQQSQGMAQAAMEWGLEQDDSEGDRQKDNDIIEYWEVYSRVGMGQNFGTMDQGMQEVRDALDSVGPNVYLALCPGTPYPLNLPPEVLTTPGLEQEISTRLSWPYPFYHDRQEPWPFTVFEFYPQIDNCWATAPLESSLPLLAFLDRAYRYLIERIKTTSKTLLVASKSLQQSVVMGMIDGFDLEFAFVDGMPGKELKNLIEVVQFPNVTQDLWQIIAAVEMNFERNTGMTAELAGQSPATQARSSAESQIRQGNMAMRPEDLAECVEDAMSKVAAKEAFMSRVAVHPSAVAPLFGERYVDPMQQQQAMMGMVPGMTQQPASTPLTDAWVQLVLSADDPARAAAEMAYSVQAGSGRKKNKAKQVSDITDSGQVILPMLMGHYQAYGDPAPVNAWLRAWGDAVDVDVTNFLLPDMRQQMAQQQVAMQQGQQQALPMTGAVA